MKTIKNLKTDYHKILQSVIDVGRKLQKSRHKNMKIFRKINEGDATNFDLLVEKKIMSAIKSQFKKSEILSEEVCYFKHKGDYQKFSKSEDLWLLDPIDGTNNLINGIPYYCIALAHRVKGRTIFGVVYDISHRELYVADETNGPWIIQIPENGKLQFHKKTVKTIKWKKNSLYRESIEQSVLGTCHFNPGHPTEHRENLEILSKLSKITRSVRKMGSAALDLCMCANGKLDGFWQRGLRPWDIAAAAYICEKSGLKTTTLVGRKFDPFEGSILVGHSKIHRQILQLIS
ncbi:MAG: inositol monophosphatase [Bacteriovoracaceae bacterium]|nr:inositol monophosphatase [Bacteriovoracaceae bacterium]